MTIANTSVQEFQKDLKEHREEEEERLMEYLSGKYHHPTIHIADIQVNPDALQLVKEVDAREAKMAAYKRLKGVLTIAINEPNNEKLAEVLRNLEEKGYSHELTLASTKNAGADMDVLQRYYHNECDLTRDTLYHKRRFRAKNKKYTVN